MTFDAELRSVKQTKRVSQDNVYTITFETDNPLLLDLGKLPSDTLFTLTVEINE